MKRIIYVFLILLFLALLAAGYLWIQFRKIAQWNENQRRIAFSEFQKSAKCPEEVLKIEEHHPFEFSDPAEKCYTREQLKYTKIKIPPAWNLCFESDKKHGEKGDKITLQGSMIRLRSDSFVAFFNESSQMMNKQGCIFKVTVSGDGRISPYIYNLSNSNTGRKEYEKALPPYRISSSFAKDYYFVFPYSECQNNFCVGIKMRGDLDFKGITVYTGRDDRDNITSIVSGKIVETSDIPDPEKSPYPDCLRTLKIMTMEIETVATVPPEFILTVPAFRNRKKTPESDWKKGDIIRFSMIRFQNEHEKIRQIQQSDTLDDFLSERYSLTGTVRPEKVENLIFSQVNLTSEKSRKYVSGYDRPQNPPLTAKEAAARKQRIAAELNRMKAILKTMPASPQELNRQFEKIWEKNRKKYQKTKDGFYWCRQGKSFFALPDSRSFVCEKDISRIVQAIKDLSDYLLLHGVSMVTVICPDCYDISARMMNPEVAGMPDYTAARIVSQLLEQGVETVYFSDEILAHAHDYDLLFYYPPDSHPAYGTQHIAARVIARYLKKAFPEVCRKQYRPEQFTEKPTLYWVSDPIRQQKQDIWKDWFPAGRPSFPKILLDGKPIQADPRSPILLYGNSYLQTPEEWPRFQLFSQLTRELNMGIACMFRAWIHPLTTMSLELLTFPEKYLKGRKVLVFYYGTLFFRHPDVWNIKEQDRANRQHSGTE